MNIKDWIKDHLPGAADRRRREKKNRELEDLRQQARVGIEDLKSKTMAINMDEIRHLISASRQDKEAG